MEGDHDGTDGPSQVLMFPEGHEKVALPPPHKGWLLKKGACGVCAHVWAGEGACACGSTWRTVGEDLDLDELGGGQ